MAYQMSKMASEIGRIADMLPPEYQATLLDTAQKFVLAWDPDYSRVTPREAHDLAEAEQSGFIDDKDMDWEHLGTQPAAT